MTQIKIVSNPYDGSLEYSIYKEQSAAWENIEKDSINSRLRERDAQKMFFPFAVKEFLDTITKEYYVSGGDRIELFFQGTTDEYDALAHACDGGEFTGKVHLNEPKDFLENPRDILERAREIFDEVAPIFRDMGKADPVLMKELAEVSDTLKGDIPVCIFGRDGVGKSTFINALLGHEILPIGADAAAPNIYEIRRSRQEDRARIRFSCGEETFALLFDNRGCKVVAGDKENAWMQELLAGIKEAADADLFQRVNRAITIVNQFAKRKEANPCIGNVIQIVAPFCEKGKLGRSQSSFALFEIPDFASRANAGQARVLGAALQGFSNGIPVWVTTYDRLDTSDGAELRDKILPIQTLDMRFAMIVVNGADQTDRGRAMPSDTQVQEILESHAVRELCASGSFFLSPMMGVGEEPDSGLYCVEEAMQAFANKYAAYGKCQAVYRFFARHAGAVTSGIADTIAAKEKSKKLWEQELKETRLEWIAHTRNASEEIVQKKERDAKDHLAKFVKESLRDTYTEKELDAIAENLAAENFEDAHFALYQSDLKSARSSRGQDLKKNVQNLFKGNFVGSVKDLAANWEKDSKDVREKKKSHDAAKREIDKATSDRLAEMVDAAFQKKLCDAQSEIAQFSHEYWQAAAREYQDALVKRITGSDALSEQHRGELSDRMREYPPLAFDEEADRAWLAEKLPREREQHTRRDHSEKLDNGRLAKRYHAKMKENLENMAEMMHTHAVQRFQAWQGPLLALAEAHLTVDNPKLHEISEIIKGESERIQNLQNDQMRISRVQKELAILMPQKERA